MNALPSNPSSTKKVPPAARITRNNVLSAESPAMALAIFKAGQDAGVFRDDGLQALENIISHTKFPEVKEAAQALLSASPTPEFKINVSAAVSSVLSKTEPLPDRLTLEIVESLVRDMREVFDKHPLDPEFRKAMHRLEEGYQINPAAFNSFVMSLAPELKSFLFERYMAPPNV